MKKSSSSDQLAGQMSGLVIKSRPTCWSGLIYKLTRCPSAILFFFTMKTNTNPTLVKAVGLHEVGFVLVFIVWSGLL